MENRRISEQCVAKPKYMHDSLAMIHLFKQVTHAQKMLKESEYLSMWMLIFQELSLYLREIYVSILWENSSSAV